MATRDKNGSLHDDANGQFTSKNSSKLLELHTVYKPLPFKITLDFFSERGLHSKPSSELRKGIRSKLRRLSEHKDKISNPEKYCVGWKDLPDIRKYGLIKFWEKEIKSHETAIQERVDILKERGEDTSEYSSK